MKKVVAWFVGVAITVLAIPLAVEAETSSGITVTARPDFEEPGVAAADPTRLELTPFVDLITLGATSKPTLVSRGVTRGLSFPIWNAGGNANEQVFFQVITPFQYNAVTNVEAHVDVALDTANTGKKFRLELAWEHTTPGVDLLPDTSNTVNAEINTGTAAQWQTFETRFFLDYDIDTPDDLIVEDILHFRLRRIAASADEIAGEVVVNHIGLHVIRGDQEGLVSEAEVELFALVMIPLALSIAFALSKTRMLAWMAGGAWMVVGGQLISQSTSTWDANFSMGFLSMLGFGLAMILEAVVLEPRRRRSADGPEGDPEETTEDEEDGRPLKRKNGRSARQKKDAKDFDEKGIIR